MFSSLPLLAVLLSGAQAQSPRSDLDSCADASSRIETPCRLAMRFSAEAVSALIGSRDSVWWMLGDRLTFVARPEQENWPRLCCAIQTVLEPLPGTSLAEITVRVPRAEEAILDVTNTGAARIKPPEVIRGPNAPPAPPTAEPLQGQLIPFAFESKALGETRRGTVYVPVALAETARIPVIYLADGATSQFAPILEAAVRDGRAAPAIIVGIDSADGFVNDCGKRFCDRRNLDYQSNQNPGETAPDPQFSRHLRFVADELVPWVEATYPASRKREDRVVAGFSSGAAWAFAAAALRPELFGNVLGMSSGSAATIHHASALGSARIYTGAGLFEPTFLASTRERARLARVAGADVSLREMVAGHSMSMWDILFAEGIAWLLPADGAKRSQR